MYYIYMLRCEDDSIYTGITTDLERRMTEHFSKNGKCAKYTLNRTAKKLEVAWEAEDRVLASKLEYHLKQLVKKNKEEVVQNPHEINKLLENKIDCSKYKIVNG